MRRRGPAGFSRPPMTDRLHPKNRKPSHVPLKKKMRAPHPNADVVRLALSSQATCAHDAPLTPLRSSEELRSSPWVRDGPWARRVARAGTAADWATTGQETFQKRTRQPPCSCPLPSERTPPTSKPHTVEASALFCLTAHRRCHGCRGPRVEEGLVQATHEGETVHGPCGAPAANVAWPCACGVLSPTAAAPTWALPWLPVPHASMKGNMRLFSTLHAFH